MGYKLSFQFSNQGLFSPYQSTHNSWIYMKMKIGKLEIKIITKKTPKQIHKLEILGKKGANFSR